VTRYTPSSESIVHNAWCMVHSVFIEKNASQRVGCTRGVSHPSRTMPHNVLGVREESAIHREQCHTTCWVYERSQPSIENNATHMQKTFTQQLKKLWASQEAEILKSVSPQYHRYSTLFLFPLTDTANGHTANVIMLVHALCVHALECNALGRIRVHACIHLLLPTHPPTHPPTHRTLRVADFPGTRIGRYKWTVATHYHHHRTKRTSQRHNNTRTPRERNTQ
jgi:hypothetical protein